jgi:hypothetical protein
MGYSCEEISGCDFHELQTRGGGGQNVVEDSHLRHDVSPTTNLNTAITGRSSPSGQQAAVSSSTTTTTAPAVTSSSSSQQVMDRNRKVK